MSSGNDKGALCEKILKDMDFIIKRNPHLESFEIIPLESNTSNTSPVLLQQNSLGLEAWCVKYVYMHCYTELMDKYLTLRKKRFSSINSTNAESVRLLLNGALLLNPDLNTFWNVRRGMVAKDLLDYNDEMAFSALVLSRKPKSNETFAYRKWLIEKYLQGYQTSTLPIIEMMIYEELILLEMCANKSPTNYHAWSHRIWFSKKMQERLGSHFRFVHVQEYIFTKFWINNHVSDFSGFHYRQYCLSNIFQLDNETYLNHFQNKFNLNFSLTKLLMKDTDSKITICEEKLSCTDEERVTLMLGKVDRHYITNISEFLRIIDVCALELSQNEEMITFYPSHEALWYHRRFIIQTMMRMIMVYFGVRGRKYSGRCPTAMNVELHEDEDSQVYSREMYDSLLFRSIKLNELEIVQTRKENDVFAVKYEKWLKLAMGLVF